MLRFIIGVFFVVVLVFIIMLLMMSFFFSGVMFLLWVIKFVGLRGLLGVIKVGSFLENKFVVVCLIVLLLKFFGSNVVR